MCPPKSAEQSQQPHIKKLRAGWSGDREAEGGSLWPSIVSRTSGKPGLREGGQRGELALGGEKGEAGREEEREGGEKSTSRKQRER